MEKIDSCRKRGRPREFDVDAALDAALLIFWRHGYEGSSLTDLTGAMGITRPALYTAFGNKEALYIEAMNRYSGRKTEQLAKALELPTARAGVERLLINMVDGLTAGVNPAGCFLVVTAMTCGPDSQPVQDAAAACRRQSAVPALLARFDRAVDDGDLPEGTDTTGLAVYVSTVMQGLAVQAASGVGRDELHRAVAIALRAFPALAETLGSVGVEGV